MCRRRWEEFVEGTECNPIMPVIVITVTNGSYGPMALVVPGAIMIGMLYFSLETSPMQGRDMGYQTASYGKR